VSLYNLNHLSAHSYAGDRTFLGCISMMEVVIAPKCSGPNAVARRNIPPTSPRYMNVTSRVDLLNDALRCN